MTEKQETTSHPGCGCGEAKKDAARVPTHGPSNASVRCNSTPAAGAERQAAHSTTSDADAGSCCGGHDGQHTPGHLL